MFCWVILVSRWILTTQTSYIKREREREKKEHEKRKPKALKHLTLCMNKRSLQKLFEFLANYCSLLVRKKNMALVINFLFQIWEVFLDLLKFYKVFLIVTLAIFWENRMALLNLPEALFPMRSVKNKVGIIILKA